MKSYFIYILSAIVITGVLLGCSKNNAGGTTPKTKTELLTQSSWKYDTAGIDANNDGIIDAALPAGYIKDCDRDNVLTFKNDSTGTVDEGPSKCDTASPQTTSFNWSFNSTQTVITSTSQLFSGIGGDFTVHSLSETEFHLGKTVTVSGISINLALYLKH
jgi:hypothetical protein